MKTLLESDDLVQKLVRQNDEPLRADMTKIRRNNLVVTIVAAEMVVLVLTQNVAISMGDSQIQVSLAVHFVFLGILALRKLVSIAELQTTLYLCSAGIALVVHAVIINHEYSAPSLMSYVIIYLMTCFVIQIDDATYRRILKCFQQVAFFVCVGVWVDWVFQLLGMSMPDVFAIIPPGFRLLDYAYIQPLVWGSAWDKPNAVVFPETSFVSVFLAMSVIIEMTFFQRMRYIILLFSSLVATFGGSGMLLIGFTVPFVLKHLRTGAVVGLLVAAPVSFVVGSQLGVFENFASRSTELSNEDTSGYHRFVDPLFLIVDSVLRDPIEALSGSGAGNSAKGRDIIWNPMAKALFEYGLIFGAIFFTLTIIFMFGYGRPFLIGWACFINYHLLGGGFVMPWFAIMAWVLVGGYHIRDRDLGAIAEQCARGSSRHRPTVGGSEIQI